MANVLPLTPIFYLEGVGQLPMNDPRVVAIETALQNGFAGKSPDQSLWVLAVPHAATASALGALLVYEPATGRIYRALRYYSEFPTDLSIISPNDIQAFRQLIASGDFDRIIQAERMFDAAREQLYALDARHPGLKLADYFDLH